MAQPRSEAERSLMSNVGYNHDEEDATAIAEEEYPGQDRRPTSTKEIYGWYSYAWAAEVFAICGMGSFIPVVLEQLAREHGHMAGDVNMPCERSEVVAQAKNGTASPGIPGVSQCIVDIFGWSMNTASFVMYTFSCSVFLQAIVIISMSGAADHGRSRKQMLLAFAVIGAVSCMLFIFGNPARVFFVSVMSQIGNVAFGASFVLLNAFLPVMVRYSTGVSPATASTVRGLNGNTQHAAAEPREEEEESLLNNEQNQEQTGPERRAAKSGGEDATGQNLSTKISSMGMAIGYFGAVLLQIGCIFIIYLTGSTTFSLQIIVFTIGLWWLLFTIPSAILLRPRPGPPLPGSADGQKRSTLSYIAYSWKRLWGTITRARQLEDVILFLAAWFMISDGVATIASSAMMFAKTVLHMSPTSLGIIGVIMPLTGMIGAMSWPKLSSMLKLSPSHTIFVCVVLFAAIPAYGLLGFWPAFANAGFGLTRPAEMYGLAVLYGFVLGGLGSYARSLFAQIVPPGHEAAFFGLYAITDKGSSMFGPAIVGLITDKTGDIRYAFIFLLLLLLVSLCFLKFVDVERGRARALAMRLTK